MSTFEIIAYSLMASILYFSPVILIFCWVSSYDSASSSWDAAYKQWSEALLKGDEDSVAYWAEQMKLAESKMKKFGG